MKLLTYSVRPSTDRAQALRRATRIDAEYLPAAVRIHDSDLTTGLQRDEHVHADTVMNGSARNARVVVVDSRGVVLGPCHQVEPRTDGADRVLKIQSEAVAQPAALDVVLLGRNPGRSAVR